MKNLLAMPAVGLVAGLVLCLAAGSAAAQNEGQAAGANAKPDDCLRIMNIWDYTPVPGNRALIVTDKARRKYKLSFMGRCVGLQYHVGLAFKSRGTGGLSCLDKGDSVVTRDVVGIPVCTISSVVRYTPQMQKADADAAAKAKAEKADKH